MNLSQLKSMRGDKLKGSDWTQLPDCQLSDLEKAEWATYRQKLRDLPAQYENNPEDIQWPQNPIRAKDNV